MKELIEIIARMKTEAEYGEESPSCEEWILTLDELIVSARQILADAH